MNSAAKYLGLLLPLIHPLLSMTLIAIPLYLLSCLLLRTFENFRDSFFIVSVIGASAIAITPAIATNYSSRYTALNLPFLLLISDRYSDATIWKAARIVLGVALGALSLWTYYRSPSWQFR